MEEGVPSLPPRPMLRLNSPKDADTDANANTNANADLSTTIVPFAKSTYVVQVPKEQIFRVPPPENAQIVEEYQNRAKAQRASPGRRSRLAGIIGIVLIIIALLCLCGVLIFYFVAKPGVPQFSVDHIAVINPSSSKPEIDITMKAQNPSAAMDLYYKGGGKVDLSHRGNQIASGDPPDFDMRHKSMTEFKLTLHGAKATLPKQMISSTAEGSKNVFALSLTADFPVKLGFGSFRVWKKELGVDCDLQMSHLKKETHIVSQICKAKF